MQISSVRFHDQSAAPKVPIFGSGIARGIEVCSATYETGYQRIQRVRQRKGLSQTKTRSYDQVLTHPERFKSRGLRGLIRLAQCLEEIAEATADISGLTERLTRNILSSAEKEDFAKIIASALGRVVTSQLNMFGFALHKAIGTAFYGLSSVVSVAVLAYATSKYAQLRSPQEIERLAMRESSYPGTYVLVARKLLGIKERQLEKLIDKTSAKTTPGHCALSRWARSMSRNHRINPENLASHRRTHSSYILNNLHQYGSLTRGLMKLSYVIFQGVNKLFVSFDKHIGTALGRNIVAKKTGDILGCRLALTLTVGAATALSIPMSPLLVGLSTVGAIACGFALAALLLAKANIYYNYDWKGDIAKKNQLKSLAA